MYRGSSKNKSKECGKSLGSLMRGRLLSIPNTLFLMAKSLIHKGTKIKLQAQLEGK